MNYLYGWNPVSEFILDELETLGIYTDGIIVDDEFFERLSLPGHVTMIAASKVTFVPGDKVINCLGYKDLGRRIRIGERLLSSGVLQTFVSQQARIHGTSKINTGTVLLGDVVIERQCSIGKHGLFWGGSRVCHDSSVGDGVFFAAGSIIGGACKVGHACSVGFNSSIREKSTVPDGTKVGANRFWRPGK